MVAIMVYALSDFSLKCINKIGYVNLYKND